MLWFAWYKSVAVATMAFIVFHGLQQCEYAERRPREQHLQDGTIVRYQKAAYHQGFVIILRYQLLGASVPGFMIL